MLFSIPSNLEIGGVKYEIEKSYPDWASESALKAGLPTNPNMLGEVDNKKALIWLHAGQSPEQLNVTFWHEVLHTGEFLIGQPSDGEDLCNLYANIVCQVLKQLT